MTDQFESIYDKLVKKHGADKARDLIQRLYDAVTDSTPAPERPLQAGRREGVGVDCISIRLIA